MYDTDNGHVLTTRNTVLLGFSHRCKKKKERPFIVQSGHQGHFHSEIQLRRVMPAKFQGCG